MVEDTKWKISSPDGVQSAEIVGDTLVLDEKSSIGEALLTGRGMQGRRSIRLCDITAVQVKRASTFSPGYIHFSCVGGAEFRGGLIAATHDPNAVLFNKASNAAVEAFAAEVERRRREMPRAEANPHPSSIATQIEKLADLRARGALTESEFVLAKGKLLGD